MDAWDSERARPQGTAGEREKEEERKAAAAAQARQAQLVLIRTAQRRGQRHGVTGKKKRIHPWTDGCPQPRPQNCLNMNVYIYMFKNVYDVILKIV